MVDAKNSTIGIGDLGADAQVVPSRGVVVSNGEAYKPPKYEEAIVTDVIK